LFPKFTCYQRAFPHQPTNISESRQSNTKMGLFSSIAKLFSKAKQFQPDFPIIPLYATEEEARQLLSQFASVAEEEPESDRTIAQKLLVAERAETRIAVGIWHGRVRFTNYLTQRFNQNDKMKGRKLGWFVNYYGGWEEFEEPNDTGYMLFLRNPTKKLVIVFGLHMGPVRVIDKDPEHWPEP
jgi:hypothetical protein